MAHACSSRQAPRAQNPFRSDKSAAPNPCGLEAGRRSAALPSEAEILLAEDADMVLFEKFHGPFGVVETEDHGRIGQLAGKTIHVFHIDAPVSQNFQDIVQAADYIPDLDGYDLGSGNGKSFGLQCFPGFFPLIDDEAENAEFRGVGQREGFEVDPGLGKDAGYFRHPAGFVFKKNGKLFKTHGSLARFTVSA
jgi:hypothetical protein